MSPGGAGIGIRTTALVGACVLWGSSFLFGKVALEELAVGHVVLGRFLLACAVLVPVALARGSLPRRADWPLVAATGVLGVPVLFLLQFEGLARTSVTSASLMIGAGAPLVALFATLFRGERLDRSGWAAVAVSTAGVGVLVGFPGPGRSAAGDLLVLLSMVASAGWVLLTARLLSRGDALSATAWPLAIGTLVLTPVAWAWDGPPPGPVSAACLGSVLALGLGCTALTYALWNWGLARVPAGRAGVYINLEPVVGALLGVGLLGDPLAPGSVLGGALVLAAAIWISRPDSAPAVGRRPLEAGAA